MNSPGEYLKSIDFHSIAYIFKNIFLSQKHLLKTAGTNLTSRDLMSITLLK